ncbi:hypothetical protein Bca52824_040971 [Brassica carinata]|uniref:Uncharacterized protein n=1 Tax=Brassica carinata TaxID=52824 RepID=A0A8X7UXB5_BRACI|nr:hypothetical protein Bca52824_040971 [Brassica carinata]
MPREKHTVSLHFTPPHPRLQHQRSFASDQITYLRVDQKTKGRRERSSPALVFRAPQLVT